MVEIFENFQNRGIPETCSCGESETMAHIYYCEKLNDEKYQKLKYECIYTGSIHEQITVFKKFEENLNERENLKLENKVEPPCDPCDPVSCIVDSIR